MTLTDEPGLAGPLPDRAHPSDRSSPVLAAGSAAVLIGILAGALYLQGTFYPVDAFGITVLALGLVAAGVAWNRDRHGLSVALTAGGLAVWWFVRSVGVRSPAAFLPFGASVVAFLAGFLVLRALVDRDRTRCGLALVVVGSLLGASGVIGVLGRWTPLARSVDGSWHAASTLTDPAATAVVCALVVLLALAADLRSSLVRIALAAAVAGLLATQGHWELMALGVGALLVPRDRWAVALWPLTCGAIGGSRRRRHLRRPRRGCPRLGGGDRGAPPGRGPGAGAGGPSRVVPPDRCRHRRGARRSHCTGRPPPAHPLRTPDVGHEPDGGMVELVRHLAIGRSVRCRGRPGSTPPVARWPTTRVSSRTST